MTKRLVEICTENCTILPDNFENNLNQLFDDISLCTDKVNNDIKIILSELQRVLAEVII